MKKIAALIAVLLIAGWFATDRFRSTHTPQPAPSPGPTPTTALKPTAAKPSSSSQSSTSAPSSALDLAATSETPPAAEAIKPPAAPPSFTYPQMTLSQVVKPNNLFRDDLFGVSATFPEGWSVKHAVRWGENNRENTVFFQAPDDSRAVPSMYYQKYPNGAPTGVSPEAYLRDLAVKKEASRQKDGFPEYQNDPGSLVYREVNGHPSLSYSATYISKNGEVHAEYFTRILGPGGYVMFFVKGPAPDVQKVIPSVYDMSGTVTTP
jgi:hypothetical protein